MNIDMDAVRSWIRERGPGVATEVAVNFLAPFLIYSLTKSSLGDVKALIVSSAPPILWSVAEFIRHRRLDALSLLVLVGIGLSLLAFFGGGGPKFLLLREKLVTAAIGVVFLGSAAIGRPLIYQLARAQILRRNNADLGAFEALQDNIYFKRVMLVMTLVWGFGLVGEAAVGVILVFALSIRAYLLVSPVLGYGTMGLLTLWTFWYRQRARRMLGIRRAAETAVAAKTPAD